jgi:subtilisin family serine protease
LTTYRLRIRRALGALALGVAVLPFCVAATASAQAPQATVDLIVRRDAGLDATERADVRADAGVQLEQALRLPDTEVVRAAPGELTEALAALEADPDVVYAEPDAPVHATATDPYWAVQWALENTGQTVRGVSGVADADIDAPGAWALGTTGAGRTIAVVDTGVNLAHPDLASQIATNPGETGGGRESNRVDDDHDGLTDDWRGWDWVAADNDPAD